MDLWMYLVVIGMVLVAIVGAVWITLWTIQRGERARGERQDGAAARPERPQPPAPPDPERDRAPEA